MYRHFSHCKQKLLSVENECSNNFGLISEALFYTFVRFVSFDRSSRIWCGKSADWLKDGLSVCLCCYVSDLYRGKLFIHSRMSSTGQEPSAVTVENVTALLDLALKSAYRVRDTDSEVRSRPRPLFSISSKSLNS